MARRGATSRRPRKVAHGVCWSVVLLASMPPVRMQRGRARAIGCGLRIEIEFADYSTKSQPRVTFDGDLGAWPWKSETVLDCKSKLVERLSCLNASIPSFPGERQ